MTNHQLSALINSIVISASIAISIPAHANGKSNSSGAPIRPVASMSGATFQPKDIKACTSTFNRRVSGTYQVFDVTYNCKGEVISYTAKLKQ
jgi:hypothetical protein